MSFREKLENYYGRSIYKLNRDQLIDGLERLEKEITSKESYKDGLYAICEKLQKKYQKKYLIKKVISFLSGFLIGYILGSLIISYLNY